MIDQRQTHRHGRSSISFDLQSKQIQHRKNAWIKTARLHAAARNWTLLPNKYYQRHACRNVRNASQILWCCRKLVSMYICSQTFCQTTWKLNNISTAVGEVVSLLICKLKKCIRTRNAWFKKTSSHTAPREQTLFTNVAYWRHARHNVCIASQTLWCGNNFVLVYS